MTRVCSLCDETKPAAEFYDKRPGELDRRCRRCRKSQYLQRRHGIDIDEFEGICWLQDGKCRICGDLLGEGKQVHIDHDHQTGVIRGVLCNNCNRGIGFLRDDPELIRSAADYLVAA